jgi:hypothetical protein
LKKLIEQSQYTAEQKIQVKLIRWDFKLCWHHQTMLYVDTWGLQHQATSQVGTLGLQAMLTQSIPVDTLGLHNFF